MLEDLGRCYQVPGRGDAQRYVATLRPLRRAALCWLGRYRARLRLRPGLRADRWCAPGRARDASVGSKGSRETSRVETYCCCRVWGTSLPKLIRFPGRKQRGLHHAPAAVYHSRSLRGERAQRASPSLAQPRRLIVNVFAPQPGLPWQSRRRRGQRGRRGRLTLVATLKGSPGR